MTHLPDARSFATVTGRIALVGAGCSSTGLLVSGFLL